MFMPRITDRASTWRRAARAFVCRPRPVPGHGSGRSGTLRTRWAGTAPARRKQLPGAQPSVLRGRPRRRLRPGAENGLL